VAAFKEILDELGLKPGDKVLFLREGNRVIVKPLKSFLQYRGSVPSRGYVPIDKIRRIVRRRLARAMARSR
jgi:bifunctional DNA-binding transcriptional regulator/antitoxin component of YhaV-PrlF toxin-antitoxin module